MRYLKLIVGSTFILLLFSNCANDSAEELSSDSIDGNATYLLNVKSIIDNNCIVCHAAIPVNGAPMSLTTYQDVKDAVLNRPLIDKISRPQGAPGMMPNNGTRLPQASIDLIIKWQEDGLLE